MENNYIQSQEEYERQLRARRPKLIALIILVIGLGVGLYLYQSDGLALFDDGSEEEEEEVAGAAQAEITTLSGALITFFPVESDNGLRLWVVTYRLHPENSSAYNYTLYVYDPQVNAVESAHEVAKGVASDETGDMFSQFRWHTRSGDTVWFVSEKHGVAGIDVNTVKAVVHEDDLVQRYGALRAGIGMRQWDQYDYKIQFTTKDGMLLSFFPALGKVLTNDQVDKEQDWQRQKRIPFQRGFGLSAADGSSPAEEYNNLRKKLFTIEYQPYPLRKPETDQSGDIAITLYFARNGLGKDRDTRNARKVSDQVYLDGKIVYADSTYVMILHRQEISPKSPQMLTLVNAATGKSSTFRDDRGNALFEGGKAGDFDLDAHRMGDTFVFSIDGFGDEEDLVLGFDASMREKWRFAYQGTIN